MPLVIPGDGGGVDQVARDSAAAACAAADTAAQDAANAAAQASSAYTSADAAQTTVSGFEARIAALEALLSGGQTMTPDVATMGFTPPMFVNGVFKGLAT